MRRRKFSREFKVEAVRLVRVRGVSVAQASRDIDVHENVLRKWVADFTYVWTAEGWLYVAAVVDLFSRRVVGWSMKAEMSAQFVTDALLMAIWRRGRPGALLHHSDRGSQGGFKRSSQQDIRFYASHWSSASAGVLNPRVFRGLALRVAATAASVSALCALRSVPFGKYWRSNPLVFSLVPRCQGL
jgi:transposase InsO family protein